MKSWRGFVWPVLIWKFVCFYFFLYTFSLLDFSFILINKLDIFFISIALSLVDNFTLKAINSSLKLIFYVSLFGFMVFFIIIKDFFVFIASVSPFALLGFFVPVLVLKFVFFYFFSHIIEPLRFKENYPTTLRLESQELRKTLLEKGAISEKEVLREDALEKIALKVYLKERLKKNQKEPKKDDSTSGE